MYTSTNIILGGDFNFIENLRKDNRTGGNLNKGDIGLKEINKLKADLSLEYVSTLDGYLFLKTTWSNGYVFGPLDRFCIPKPHLRLVVNIKHNISSFYGHKIAILTIKLSNSSDFSQSYWKCNIKILENKEVKDDLETIFRWEKSKDVSPSWWDELKQKVKKNFIGKKKRILPRTAFSRIRKMSA